MRRYGFIWLLLFCQQGWCQIYTSPTSLAVPSDRLAAAFFSLDTIEYENGETKMDFEVERKVLGLELATDTKQEFGLVGQFTFSPDIRYTNGGDGTGYSLAGGLRGRFDQTQKGTIYTAVFFSYVKDDIRYDSAVGSVDVDLTVTELTLQAAYAMPMGAKTSLYVAIDLIPMVDGELSSSPGGRADVERDDILRLRLGSTLISSGYILRPEIAFVGGHALSISIAKPI